MSHVAVTGFTQAVLVLVALRKGLQEVHEIANATGDKVQKVGVWLEAFHWAGIVNVKLSTKGEGSSFLWELNTNQEAVSQRKESPPRINPHKVTIAEFLNVVLVSPKTVEDIDVNLGISLSTVRKYFKVLVERKVVRICLTPRTGKHGPERRAYISQLFVPDNELVDSSGELETNHRTNVAKIKKERRTSTMAIRGDVPNQRWVTNWTMSDAPPKPISIFNLVV